jgi:NADH-quinone oxidoreductase subunit N
VLALLLLALEIVLPKRLHAIIPDIASAGRARHPDRPVAQLELGHARHRDVQRHDRPQHRRPGHAGLLPAVGALVCLLARVSLAKQPMPRIEFYHIVLVGHRRDDAPRAEQRHFLMLFVALETLTIGLYILVRYFRTSTASLEAGLKYL